MAASQQNNNHSALTFSVTSQKPQPHILYYTVKQQTSENGSHIDSNSRQRSETSAPFQNIIGLSYFVTYISSNIGEYILKTAYVMYDSGTDNSDLSYNSDKGSYIFISLPHYT